MALTDNLGGLNWVASANPPENKSLLWLDTSNPSKSAIKYYDGSNWVLGVTPAGINAVADYSGLKQSDLPAEAWANSMVYRVQTSLPDVANVYASIFSIRGDENTLYQYAMNAGKLYFRVCTKNGAVENKGPWGRVFYENNKGDPWNLLLGFDQNTAVPTATTMLRWNGFLRATRLYGMYYSDNADVAELYDAVGNVTPGTVLSIRIDGSHAPCKTFGDEAILGVVSTKYAFLLGQVEDEEAEGKYPVALAGRTPVRVWGPVIAGQLLVSSDQEGCAEVCETPAVGTVIAQSLETNLEDGEHLVMCIMRRC